MRRSATDPTDPEVLWEFTDSNLGNTFGNPILTKRNSDGSWVVLFTSGYTENAIVHRGVLEAGVELLAKPFSPTELRARVRELLDRR